VRRDKGQVRVRPEEGRHQWRVVNPCRAGVYACRPAPGESRQLSRIFLTANQVLCMIGTQLLSCGLDNRSGVLMSLAKTPRAPRLKRPFDLWLLCALCVLAREPSSFAWFAYFAVEKTPWGPHGLKPILQDLEMTMPLAKTQRAQRLKTGRRCAQHTLPAAAVPASLSPAPRPPWPP
jgi:hypothetical protein